MPYNGPPAGVINIVSGVNTNPASAPVPPSSDIGGDGDFAYDTDTQVLYGPKDSTQTNPWPTSGLALNAVLRDRGTFKVWGAYNINDVVFDRFTSQQYICTSAIDYGTPSDWVAQSYAVDSIVRYNESSISNNQLTFRASTSAASTDVPSVTSSVWRVTSPSDGLSRNYWAGVDPSIAFGAGMAASGPKYLETSLMVPRRVLMNGAQYINPNGMARTVGNPGLTNYLVDSGAIQGSSTLMVSGTSSNGQENTIDGSVVDLTTMGGYGPGLTVELRGTAVTPSPTSTGYSRVTVDAYGRVTAASNGLQTAWETRSTAGSALTSANFAVEFTGTTALTCTLAAPSSTNAGRVHMIKNSTTQALTVQCTGTPANSINNSTSYSIPAGTVVQFISAGSSASGYGWRVITNVLTNQANTFTAAQTVKPTSDGTVLTVSNAAGTYAPFSVDSTGTTTILQGLQFQTLIDGTSPAAFKSSDGTTILAIDTSNKTLTTGSNTTASGTGLSSTNKLVDSKATASGTAVSTSNPMLDAASAMIERSGGMWLYPWNLGNSGAATSAQARFTRFRANRPLIIKSMAVVITANSTNAETLQFGLYDSAGNRLVSTGNATLYTTAGGSTTTNTTTAGVKYAALPGSGYQLVAGYEYYAAFSYTYTSGTGITFTQAANVGNANAFQLFGTTVGTFDAAAQATSTLPSTMASATVSTIQPTFALLTT